MMRKVLAMDGAIFLSRALRGRRMQNPRAWGRRLWTLERPVAGVALLAAFVLALGPVPASASSPESSPESAPESTSAADSADRGAPAQSSRQTKETAPVTTRKPPASPPRAKRIEHRHTHHEITLVDPYHWLRDPSYPTVDDPEILAHLEAENAWFEARMAGQKQAVERLFSEMRARIKEEDSSVPQKDGDWLYWSEFEQGAQYRKHYRRSVAGGEPVLILDENALAEGHEYFRLGAMSVSQSGRYLAYSVDTNGSERFTAYIKDLETGELLSDTIPETLSGLVWVANDRGIVYGRANENWRVLNARLHWIGQPVEQDVELYHEPDESFRVSAGLSAREDWLIITTGDNETSEVRLVRADDPTGEQILVRERRKGIEYAVDVRDEELFVLTNDEHINFRLARASLERPGEWQTLIAGSDDFYLTGFELFADFFVTEGRLDGLDQVQIRRYQAPLAAHPIAFPEASYSAGLSNNPEYDVDRIRLSYESMVTPDSVYDYHVAEGRLELLKRQEIPSGYDPSLYATERLSITARDGVKVPVSIVYRKDRPRPGTGTGGPLHLYAYGAYGYAVPPGFSTTRLSLVDRGYAFAIAHIRGGDDLGRRWYLQGKLFDRRNSFDDFVDVARGLIELGYTAPGRISASGGSAGGELMGAVVNQAPELFGAVVAHVPFVDVLNTMLDPSLPLTPGEWQEWGNPITSKEAFAYMLSYSPYDQVRPQPYPPMLVTAGLNDPRVTYWEPAKWVARLRELKTDDNELLLKTNMGAGHGGKSGRWNSLYEVAEEYAFILWQMGVPLEASPGTAGNGKAGGQAPLQPAASE